MKTFIKTAIAFRHSIPGRKWLFRHHRRARVITLIEMGGIDNLDKMDVFHNTIQIPEHFLLAEEEKCKKYKKYHQFL